MYPRAEPFVATEERVLVKAEPYNAEARPRALAEPVTPVGAHYVRAHFGPPRLDAGTHAVAVGGAVAQPFTLRLAELAKLPRRHVTMTMECAGNHRLRMAPLPPGEPWDAGALSTASWSGVPLALILERAGVRDDAMEIVCRGADGGVPDGARVAEAYARALPIDKARHLDTLLALEMNGRPLPVEHGGPLRLIVPDWYGMASVKWLAAIEAVTAPFAGWFQRDRYVYDDGEGHVEPVTEMRVRAHLAAPVGGTTLLRGRVRAWGWAWSGAGTITSVELSLDGGPYRAAALGPSLAPHAWRRFELAFDVKTPGRHTLRARARDASGDVQPETSRWNRWGYGNNGVQTIAFTIA